MDTSLASTCHSVAAPTDTQEEQQQQNVYSNIVPSFRRCRALVLDSSYRPIDVVNWQRAICLDLFDKASLLCQELELHLYRLDDLLYPATLPGICMQGSRLAVPNCGTA